MSGAWLTGWRPYALLGLLCLCLYLPGIAAIPVLDRDEARFAEATRQMLDSGDFLHIRFQDEARNSKPAGIYWLQAASVVTLSTAGATAIWPYRVPSLLAAGLAVLLTFRLGRALTGAPRTAMIAAVLLAIALGTVAEAHIAKTDAALLAAVSAGQGALGLCYVRSRAGQKVAPGIALGFWLAEIAAIFLKGPIAPGIALATAAALSLADRDLKWLLGLRPLLGLAAMILAVAPWLYAIEHATEGQFLGQSVGRDFWGKITGGQEAHGAPPLYYVVLAFASFWPGSLLLAPAVIGGWRRRGEPVARFLLAWLVPAWVALELVPTKLPHYTLPLYPALALLAAAAVTRDVEGGRWARWVRAAGTSLWLLATVLLAAALIVAPLRLGGGPSAIGIVGAAAIIALAIALAAALLYRRHVSIAVLAAMALVFVATAGHFIVPRLDRLWLSRGAAALVARHQPPDGTMLAVVGYNEPSLVFLTGNRVKAQTADVPVAAGSEALVSSRDDAAFRQAIASQGLTAQRLDSVAGADYSNGQEMTLILYKIAPK